MQSKLNFKHPPIQNNVVNMSCKALIFNKHQEPMSGGVVVAALRDVPGFNGAYAISNEGRVYRRLVVLQGLGSRARRIVKLRELQPCRGWGNRPTVALYADGKRQWSGAISVLVKEVFG
jgi:hypothetical protein